MASNKVTWEELSSQGPTVAFAASCILDGSLYLHGGVSEARSTKPLSTLYKFNIPQSSWELVNNSGPSLSHHVCLTVDDQHLILIGGWNGKERSSQVFLLDCTTAAWLSVETSGFPVGAGLSSHTANLISNGDILVVGREGGLRTQRRSGSAFILSRSVAKRRFTYKDMPLSVSSRSGHTASIVKNTIIIVGGRDDKLLEVHKITPGAPALSTTLISAHLFSDLPCLAKLPGGRKHHSAVLTSDSALIFGGETFDGRSKEPVSELFAIDINNNYGWKSLGKTNIGRAGHMCAIYNNSIILHGGVGESNRVTNLTFMLKLGAGI